MIQLQAYTPKPQDRYMYIVRSGMYNQVEVDRGRRGKVIDDIFVLLGRE